MIKPIIKGQATSFEVLERPTNEYNAWLQGRLSKSVWTECNSYYHNGTKLVATYPGPVSLFWWMVRSVRWKDFKVQGAQASWWWRDW